MSNNYVNALDLKDLGGKWYVALSNAAHWKQPGTCVNYSEQTNGLKEEESFPGKGRAYSRTFFTLKTSSSHFKSFQTRRLHPFPDRWYVVAMDANKQWIVVYRVSGFYRREGIVVISRSARLSAESKEQIGKLFRENYFLQAKTKRMKEIDQGK